MNEKLYKLFRLQCADLLVLADMEYNGMLYETKAALKEAHSLQEKSDDLLRQFHLLVGNDSVSISSGDNISSVLYGGIVKEEFRLAVGHYKSGTQKGEVKYGKEILEHTFPQLVKPIKDTETSANKAGKKDTYSVAEDVLKKLKGKGKAKEIISCILEYRGLEKLRSTYLQGWSDLIDKKGWTPGTIHGTLNQCVAVTGRLSSDSPNLQNASKEVKKFLITRY